jgi:hypothetical protein
MGDVWEEYDEHKKRFRKLPSKFQQILENERSIDEEEQRILEALDSASGEDKAALLFEARELQTRRQQCVEEQERLVEEFEQIEAAQTALSTRANERLEDVRSAALETEKMLFEIGKLVATLAIGTIVAMTAVTPALLPKLDNLAGLWPAFVWLLISVGTSVFLCMYCMMQVSQLLARPRRRSKPSRLPRWSRHLIGRLPYMILGTFSVGALVIGLYKFALFVSTNIG